MHAQRPSAQGTAYQAIHLVRLGQLVDDLILVHHVLVDVHAPRVAILVRHGRPHL